MLQPTGPVLLFVAVAYEGLVSRHVNSARLLQAELIQRSELIMAPVLPTRIGHNLRTIRTLRCRNLVVRPLTSSVVVLVSNDEGRGSIVFANVMNDAFVVGLWKRGCQPASLVASEVVALLGVRIAVLGQFNFRYHPIGPGCTC